MHKIYTLSLLCLLTICSGCATLVGSQVQTVPIETTPSGINFVIKDETGIEVARGKTPKSVILQKSNGSYFGGKSYQITFHKAHLQPVTVPLVSKPNGWYIVGNFAFFGWPGWLLVDPFNGGMYTLYPENVNVPLQK